jgi:hypothetical protein
MRTMHGLEDDPALSVLNDLGTVYAIHGYITDISRFTHAWVEVRGGGREFVYDQIRSKTLYDRAAYYAAYDATPILAMTGKELAIRVLEHNYDGPFIEEEQETA